MICQKSLFLYIGTFWQEMVEKTGKYQKTAFICNQMNQSTVVIYTVLTGSRFSMGIPAT